MYKIAIIGLGYVGLPLAVEFGKSIKTTGYDINYLRVEELKAGGLTLEVEKKELNLALNLNFTSDPQEIKDCNVYIVTVPTPFKDIKNLPLNFVVRRLVHFSIKGILVIYESTVYPGCTEEDCVPVLEKYSKLKFNQDFFCGYSPERINPGDKEHTVSNIKKITSGSTPEIADLVDDLYNEIVTVGTHKAPSIKVAEAAKVIENTQRDLNIALN